MRLSDCFVDLIAYVTYAMENRENLPGGCDALYARLEDLIRQSEMTYTKHDFSREDYDLARFAVFVWIDETIMKSTWESKGGHPPPSGTTGLFHTAILYPTRAALADALHRVISAGIPLDGASDHGVSEALYLRDPDENGVELYHDRPQSAWPRNADGSLAMFTRRLDVEDLLRAREV